MRQMLKRSLALFMAIVMCFGLVHFTVGTAHAAEGGEWKMVTDAANLQVGDQIVIVATGYNYAMSTTQNGNNRGQAAVTKSGDTVTFGNDVQKITLEDGTAAGTFAFKVDTGYLHAASNSKNYLRTQDSKDANASWLITIASSGVATIKAQGDYTRNWMRYNNSSSIFACYSSGQGDIAIYKLFACQHTNTEVVDAAEATCTEDGYTGDTVCVDCGEEIEAGSVITALGHTYENDICTVCGANKQCNHTNTETVEGKAPTCTETGLTEGSKCADCGETVTEQEQIDALGHDWKDADCTTPKTCEVCGITEGAALGHDYVDGICTVCNDVEPVAKTLTFDANKANRISHSTTQQVWKQNGITFTNDKASSNTNVADYSNPVRLYQGSSITIDCLSMAKIELICNSGSYATSLKNSIPGNDATVSGSVVTITLPAVANTYTIASLGAQVRINSITVYAKPCQHTNTEAMPAVDPTCTEAGKEAGGKKCVDCGEILEAQTEIPATGHTEEVLEAVAPTCTETGLTAGVKCTVCGDILTAQEVVEATGHKFEGGVCTNPNCGAQDPNGCAHENTEVLPAKAATCTETGLTAGEKCTDCEEVLTAQEVIPATGHNFVNGICTNSDCDQVQVEYVYSSDGNNYIYNWGTREEEATFLSPKAETFYSGQNTYEYFSELAGGTGTADAPYSELYSVLKTFMSNRHQTETTYAGTRYLFKYTDCQNSNGVISGFYSGNDLGTDWDGNAMNREHVWPNSKGDASGNGENDIIMIHPAVPSINSSRGNDAYGESSDYCDPGKYSVTGVDVRGDAARTVLYVYVRWGNTGYMWGSAGVMENLDVLLKWIEEDPVDTWELGRNDSVESITGTRNVFVDYPELAFLLFGAEIPEDMTTPSGEAKNTVTCEHNYVAGTPVAPTCTTEGYTVYTCSLCSRSYSSDKVPATGHNFVDGVCTNPGCDEVEPESQSVKIYYPAGQLYVTATASGKKLAAGSAAEAALWEMSEHEQGYVSFSVNGKYLTSGATGNELTLAAELTDCGLWEVITTDGGVYLRNVGANYNGNYNQYLEYYSGFTTYGFNSSNVSIYTFILQPVGGSTECQHSWQDATCTAPKTCPLCGATEGEALGHDWKDADCTTPKTCEVCGATEGSALGHNYVDGACTVCGEAKPSGTQATITFDDTSKRLEQTTSKQVWTENGITVTNEKGASTNDIINSKNPVRFYKNSTVIIAYPGMTKIEVTCNTYSDYASALQSSITDGTVTVSGNVVTITLAAAADSYTVVLSGGQVRVDSITVYAADTGSGEGGGEETPCQHDWKNATCTEPKTCKLCGQTEGEALGHNYFGGTCTRCGAVENVGHIHSFTHTVISVPTCEAVGITLYSCNSCYYSYTVATKATGHKFVDGTCTVCGKVILEDGSSVTVTDESVEVIISKDAVSSEEDVVVLPIPEITVSTSETAPTVTIDVSDIETDAAVKVEIPVADVTESTVVVIVHEDGTEEIMQKTAVTENGLAFEMEGNVTVKVVDNAKEFEDVSDDSWSSEAVNFTTSREILGAADDGKFAPKNNMTCIQLTTLLFSMDNKSPNLSNDELEVKAIEWAEANQIVNSAFQGEKALTREQLVDFIYRYAGAPKLASNTGRFAKFTDCDTVSSWARDAMIWAVEEGVINGMGDDTLNPTGKATREQVAQVLMNLINKQ